MKKSRCHHRAFFVSALPSLPDFRKIVSHMGLLSIKMITFAIMMKKTLAALAAGVALLCSCGGGEATTATVDGISFDSIVVDTTVQLIGDGSKSPECRIRLSMQYAKGDKRAALMNDSLLHSGLLVPDYLALGNEQLDFSHAVDSFVSRYAADYQRDYAPLYRQDQQNEASYNAEYRVTTRTQNGRDNVVCYLADVYTYGGGAHGNRQTIVKNINVETGHVMTLHDVFAPGFEQGLCEEIMKRLCKAYDAKGIEGLRQQGILVGIDLYPTDNFVLGKDEITFIYVEDEIAPHATGEIKVVIPYSDLDHILKQKP